MFGHGFFARSYFGPTYFGPKAGLASIVGTVTVTLGALFLTSNNAFHRALKSRLRIGISLGQ